MAIQQCIARLAEMPPLPSEDDADPKEVLKYEELIRSINCPISNEEAKLLVNLFGIDGCFGLAASLVQRIETAPGWPLLDTLVDSDNPWIRELLSRSRRGGRI